MSLQLGLRADLFLQLEVPDAVLEERICNRRTDPVTGAIYNLRFKPPPADCVDRLMQVRAAWGRSAAARYGGIRVACRPGASGSTAAVACPTSP